MPLTPDLSQRLKNFMKGMKPDERVFILGSPSITMKIKQFARKAGLNDLHAHTLRHKFATDLLEKGANIKAVQELLGHTNLSTTEVYLSITEKTTRDAVMLLDVEKPPKTRPNPRATRIKGGWVVPPDTVEEVHIPKSKRK